jgi:hypothetical protein
MRPEISAVVRTDALLWPTQAQGATPPPYTPDSWISYAGGEATLLAVVLLVVAGGFAYAGKRLRAPIGVTRPEGIATGFMIAIWLLAIYTVLVATFVYGLQVKQAYPGFVPPRVRVGTFVDAPVTFFVASVGLRSATPSEAAIWQRHAVSDGRFVQTELAEIIAPLVLPASIDLDEG